MREKQCVCTLLDERLSAAAHQFDVNQTCGELGRSLQVNRFPLRAGHATRNRRLLDRTHKLKKVAFKRRRLSPSYESACHVDHVPFYLGTSID